RAKWPPRDAVVRAYRDLRFGTQFRRLIRQWPALASSSSSSSHFPFFHPTFTAICHHGRGKTDDLAIMPFVESFKRGTACESDDGDMCAGVQVRASECINELLPCPTVIDSAVSLGYSRLS
ncbi:hypothetical protein CCMA1212_006933, partial [Trichoderma ghanense]